MGMVVILVAPILEELLCRAIIPRLIFRGAEPIGYLAGALFFTYLHGPSTLGEWVAYGGMSLILTWVAYRYQRIEYSICLHMTLNALAIIIQLYSSFVYCQYGEFSSMINYDKMVGTNEF